MKAVDKLLGRKANLSTNALSLSMLLLHKTPLVFEIAAKEKHDAENPEIASLNFPRSLLGDFILYAYASASAAQSLSFPVGVSFQKLLLS